MRHMPIRVRTMGGSQFWPRCLLWCLLVPVSLQVVMGSFLFPVVYILLTLLPYGIAFFQVLAKAILALGACIAGPLLFAISFCACMLWRSHLCNHGKSLCKMPGVLFLILMTYMGSATALFALAAVLLNAHCSRRSWCYGMSFVCWALICEETELQWMQAPSFLLVAWRPFFGDDANTPQEHNAGSSRNELEVVEHLADFVSTVSMYYDHGGRMVGGFIEGESHTAALTCGDGACALHTVLGTPTRNGELKMELKADDVRESVVTRLSSNVATLLDDIGIACNILILWVSVFCMYHQNSHIYIYTYSQKCMCIIPL